MQDKEGWGRKVQTDLGDVVGSVPDDHNKANITRKSHNYFGFSVHRIVMFIL